MAPVFCALLASITHAQMTLYVDDDAPAGGDGSSWALAFTHLQDALDAAAPVTGAGMDVEVRVAGGEYKPDQGASVTPDDRSHRFVMQDNLSLRGGYAGLAQPGSPDDRDFGTYTSTLSGELGDPMSILDNSYHVLRSYQVENALIEGFTFTRGYADGPALDQVGGGASIQNSEFTITDCVFIDNHTPVFGGGMYISFSDMILTRCDFFENTAERGGGLYLADRGDPRATNCRFMRNHATEKGGGLLVNRCATPILMNCLLVANACDMMGGAIFDYSNFQPHYKNCTIAYNTAATGAAIFQTTSNGNGRTRVQNCVLWRNNEDATDASEAEQIFIEDGFFFMDYTCVQGLTGALGGAGNTGCNPRFVDPAGVDGVLGTLDDDFRLGRASTLIDAGNNMLVPFDLIDIDEDAVTGERLPLDLDGAPRFEDAAGYADIGVSDGVNALLDMGAYEAEEAADGPCPADLDGDGAVGAVDLASLLGSWGSVDPCLDLDGVGAVGAGDIATLIGSWGVCP